MPSRFTELGHRKRNRLGRNVKRQWVLRSAQCYEPIPSPSCIKIDLSCVPVHQELCPHFLIYTRVLQASYSYHAQGTFSFGSYF